MIIKSKKKLQFEISDKQSVYPVLPLQTGILFPGTMITIQIGRKENLELINKCNRTSRKFIAAYSPHNGKKFEEIAPIHQVGVLAVVRDVRPGAGRSVVATIEGLKRIALNEVIQTAPFVTASAVQLLPSKRLPKNLKDTMDEVISTVEEITNLDPTLSQEHLRVLKMSFEDPSLMADTTANLFRLSLESQQELLETIDLPTRFKLLLQFLNSELNQVATVHRINTNVEKSLEDEKEKQYLRQQLHEIKKLLGEDFAEEEEAKRYKKKVKSMSQLPQEVIARANIEADRLVNLSTASAEYGVTKNYLDWLLGLPWNKSNPEDYKIEEVEKILTTEYYGPKLLKEQILQRLTVRKHLGGINEGPTLCLVGAPGTGKAAIGKAIAKALGKDFVRVSVGGISDVSELKGTPRTFLGALPGKIIRALRDAGTSDPVMLIEDIDYFNIENDSAVNMALLEVVDNRLNSRFLDNYIGVPFDLSKVLFICSVRAFEDIPEQFLSRFELMELPGYIEREKIVITKRYIIPKLLKKHGLTKAEFNLSDKILANIINTYTQEAGLLGLSQLLDKIFRKVLLEKVTRKKKKWSLTDKNLDSYLGQSYFIPEKAEKDPEIGIAAGLAWTGAGGDLMFIEGIKMRGEGLIQSTGSLGEVMKESIQAAHSYVRSKADVLGIDINDFNEFDIHIHFPSGAIPKDGPSAGVTVSLVLASILSERPIRNDIAMTGEVTLRGKVLPVGGIKEKVSAAYRAGIYHVAIPKENKKDIKDLPREILRKTKISYLEKVDDLFKLCLLDFTPSAFTLEKIFAEEIKKAKKKTTSAKRKANPKSKSQAAKKKSSK
ncbi:MAG: endopeptidase La [Calditrichaeota bacterium]|nr:MAG: endopeptidase La [Calditrichota bacterium]